MKPFKEVKTNRTWPCVLSLFPPTPGILLRFNDLIQKAAQLERVPCSLIDVFKSVWPKVDASKVARHND